ncbi:hypothetical protein AB0C74_03285 [Spirillospora sp. NPDC048832]
MGYPELAADTAALHRTGKAFTEMTNEGGSLSKAHQSLNQAEVPDLAFGKLPMSRGLRETYEEALRSHKHNLDIVKKYLSESGAALQKVSANIRKAEDDSTL